jgi:hypothetical protein
MTFIPIPGVHAGDNVTVTYLLSTTEANLDDGGNQPLVLNTSAGIFNFTTYNDSRSFTFQAHSSAESLTAFIQGYDADEVGDVTVSVNQRQRFTAPLQAAFLQASDAAQAQSVFFDAAAGAVSSSSASVPLTLAAALEASLAHEWSNLARYQSDPNFSGVVQPSPHSLPPITADAVLTTQEANAFNAWFGNLEQQLALDMAIGTSINRANGAADAGNASAESAQLSAANRYLGQLKGYLDAEPSLLSSLQTAVQNGGLPRVTLAAGDVFNFEQNLLINGLPSLLSTTVGQLGEDANALENIRQRTYVQDINAAAGSLPAKLTDASYRSAVTTLDQALVNGMSNPLSGAGVDMTATAGRPQTGMVATFADASGAHAASFYQAMIIWGNGTTAAGTVAPDPNGGFDVTGTTTYATATTYSISVQITDSASHSLMTQSTATVSSEGNPLSATGINVSATAGVPFSGAVARFTDASGFHPPSFYHAQITWGDGNTSNGLIAAAEGTGGGFIVTGLNTYAAANTYPITVQISDAAGHETTAHSVALVTTSQGSPLSAAGINISAMAGVAFTGAVATFTDSSGTFPPQSYQAVITWGDGNTSFGFITANAGGGFTVTGTNTYAANNTYTITVQINDFSGHSVSTQSTANVGTVSNPLSGAGVNVSPTAGAPFTGVVATFTDSSGAFPPGYYHAVITWGDGNTSNGTITSNGSGGFNVSGSDTFESANNYTVTVQITDAGSNTVTTQSTATVGNLGIGPQAGETGDFAFWSSPGRGLTLILHFNGGSSSRALATWLATTFPNLYGNRSGTSHDLTGKSNADVAALYMSLSSSVTTRLQAQILAAALNVYATTTSLGGGSAQAYGFTVTDSGLGSRLFNVGSNGAAFGVDNNSNVTVFQLLRAVNRMALFGLPYNGDPGLSVEALIALTALNLSGPLPS